MAVALTRRSLAVDRCSEAAQDLCSALHTEITAGNEEEVAKLTHGDAELVEYAASFSEIIMPFPGCSRVLSLFSLVAQYQERTQVMRKEREKLTERFGIIHSAKVAIKSEYRLPPFCTQVLNPTQ